MYARLFAMMGLALLPAIASAQVTQIVTKTNGQGQVTETDTTSSAGPAATSADIALANSAIPGSGITPATSLATGAGTEEASLLEYVTVQAAAKHLSGLDALAGLTDKSVLMVAQTTQTPDISAWQAFTQTADTYHTLIRNDLESLHPYEPAGARIMAVPLAAVLPIAQHLLSYANTSYQLGGLSLTADDYLVEMALKKVRLKWAIYGQRVNAVISPEIKAKIDTLMADIKDARELQGRLSAVLAALQAKSDDASKAKAAQLTVGLGNVTADVTAISSFVSASYGGTAMPAIANSLQFQQALTPAGGGVLFLKMHSASGGVLTRTTMWSNLGIGMPISASQATTVSYSFYKNDGSIGDAGVFVVAVPYQHTNNIVKFLQYYGTGKCEGPADANDKWNKYCPVVIDR